MYFLSDLPKARARAGDQPGDAPHFFQGENAARAPGGDCGEPAPGGAGDEGGAGDGGVIFPCNFKVGL